MSGLLPFAGWVCAGIASSGFFYAFAQRHYSKPDAYRRADCFMSILVGLVSGPIGMAIVILFALWRHGWLFPGAKP